MIKKVRLAAFVALVSCTHLVQGSAEDGTTLAELTSEFLGLVECEGLTDTDTVKRKAYDEFVSRYRRVNELASHPYWSCSKCTFLSSPTCAQCEMCQKTRRKIPAPKKKKARRKFPELPTCADRLREMMMPLYRKIEFRPKKRYKRKTVIKGSDLWMKIPNTADGLELARLTSRLLLSMQDNGAAGRYEIGLRRLIPSA